MLRQLNISHSKEHIGSLQATIWLCNKLLTGLARLVIYGLVVDDSVTKYEFLYHCDPAPLFSTFFDGIIKFAKDDLVHVSQSIR